MNLLQEEVRLNFLFCTSSKALSLTAYFFFRTQRLSGASLLVFKNKSDVAGAMTEDEVREVSELSHTKHLLPHCFTEGKSDNGGNLGTEIGQHQNAPLDHYELQRHDGSELDGRPAVGCEGC